MEENKKDQGSNLNELDELLNGEANYKNASDCAHILRQKITKLKNNADYRLMKGLETAELKDTTNDINTNLANVIKIQNTITKYGHQITDSEFYVGMMKYLKRENETYKLLEEKEGKIMSDNYERKKLVEKILEEQEARRAEDVQRYYAQKKRKEEAEARRAKDVQRYYAQKKREEEAKKEDGEGR